MSPMASVASASGERSEGAQREPVESCTDAVWWQSAGQLGNREGGRWDRVGTMAGNEAKYPSNC